MDLHVTEHRNTRILEWASPIARMDDALAVVSASYEHDTRALLLAPQALSPAFVDLRTRVAGEFLQKIQNYHLIVALWLPETRDWDDRFDEFLRETKRSRTCRAFAARDEAIDWLAESA